MFNNDKNQEEMFWSTETDRKGNLVWKSFKRYQTDKKEKEFKPKNSGAAFANSHEEVNNSNVLVQKEVQYISDINSFIDELQEWFEKGIGSIKKTIEGYSINRNIKSTLDDIQNKFEHDTDKKLLSFKNDQEIEIVRRREATRAYGYFKYEHERKTDAIYPDSKIFVFSLVIGAIVIEGLLNAFFFKEVSSLGLLGGFLAAAFASVVNVGWSFIMGWAFLRMIHQTEVEKTIKQVFFRVSGGILFILSIGLIGALHLTIAHFRELANNASGGGV